MRLWLSESDEAGLEGHFKNIGQTMHIRISIPPIALAGLLVFSATAFAQMPVEITAQNEGNIGQIVVYKIKEEIRKSQALRPARADDGHRVLVKILTMDQNPARPGQSAAISAVILWNNRETPLPFFLYQNAGVCYRNDGDVCAFAIVASIAEQAERIVSLFEIWQHNEQENDRSESP